MHEFFTVSGILIFRLTDAIQVLKPHVAERGDLDPEHHVAETPRDLWRVRGMAPPELGSVADVL